MARPLPPSDESDRLDDLIGQDIVVDLSSQYVIIGRFIGYDVRFLELADADLHDFRDSQATREVYVYNAVRLGIRRNRTKVLVCRDEVVALTLLADVVED